MYSRHHLMSAEFGDISTSLHLFSIVLLITASYVVDSVLPGHDGSCPAYCPPGPPGTRP